MIFIYYTYWTKAFSFRILKPDQTGKVAVFVTPNPKLSISRQMARFSLNLRYEEIPAEQLAHGRMLLLDTFGVAMSCRNLPHAKAVHDALEEMQMGTGCTLWGGKEQARLADAVLYNSCLIHGADYDDTHVGAILHPSAAVVAMAVTLGEQTGASGRDMMTAIVAGWEIAVRLGLAAKGRFHDVGYHGSGIIAPFAAACVAGRLMNVSEDELVNALGICGSQSAALQEFLHDGSWTKKIHPGWGCHSAVYALSMAKHGFVGPAQVMEGGFGLWATHCGGTDGLEEEMADLGSEWHTEEIAFKMYPVCHMTHSFIDCIQEIMRTEKLTAEDIESMECRIEERCYHIVCTPEEAKKHPETDYMMRFSLPYVAAITAIRGQVSPWEIDLKYASDPQVVDLMSRVTCISDESKRHPGYFPGWVRMTLRDGRSFVCDHRYELGTKENPIKLENVIEKFHNNVSPFYSEEQIARITDVIRRFDSLEGTAELLSALEMQ